MKQNWWKHFLSYFIEFSIEKRKSEYSDELEICYRQGRYALCTKNAVYSYEDLYINFRETFKQIRWDQYQIENVLLLGLGLGSVPLLLEKSFKKHFSYTMVEIDPEVISLAQKYGLSSLKSPQHLVCADAYTYVMQEQKKYDLIIVDLFIDTVVPTIFETNRFLKKLEVLLTNKGLLMYNRLTLTDEAQTCTEYFYKSVFKSVFLDAHSLKIKGNQMLLSTHK